ncbi:MAG: IS110 family transposase [Gemmatimonadota bacterium]|jgi:transposase
MTTGATRREEDTTVRRTLHVALELDDKRWTLAFTTGLGQRPRTRAVAPRDREAVLREVERAKRRFGLEGGVRVVSCYEAGREGFCLHRWLEYEGIENRVVDAASIEVSRRRRRAKSDRLDVGQLLTKLVRYEAGDRRVWSVVRVPTVEEEDARHLTRDLSTMKRERTRASNRIKGLLATQGVRLSVSRCLPAEVEDVRLWDGSTLPPGLKARVLRTWEHWQWVHERILACEKERRQLLRTSQAPEVEKVRQLMMLHGIGDNSAWPFVVEFFGWRRFRNRREVGALAGLAPTGRKSGQELDQELGISEAGSAHIRAIAIEIAWGWLRHQPQSALSVWYREKYADHGRRMRKIGIVALARRLLIGAVALPGDGRDPRGSDAAYVVGRRRARFQTDRRLVGAARCPLRGPEGTRPASEMGPVPPLARQSPSRRMQQLVFGREATEPTRIGVRPRPWRPDVSGKRATSRPTFTGAGSLTPTPSDGCVPSPGS